jgi:hypothetical protein
VLVVCLSPRDSYPGKALTYLHLYIAERLEVAFPATPEAMVTLAQGLADCAVIVDAILGTGTQGRVCEPAASVIAAVPAEISSLPSIFRPGSTQTRGDLRDLRKGGTDGDFCRSKARARGEGGVHVLADIGMPQLKEGE